MASLSHAQERALRREVKALCLLHHPRIIRLLEAVESRDGSVSLVMEYAPGGELFNSLARRLQDGRGPFGEAACKKLFSQVVDAISVSHRCKICHRDIKLENILLDEYGDVKLGDWGFAAFITPGQLLSDFLGSAGYAAPELVQRQPYDGRGVDMWAVGVCLYTCLTGFMPFDGATVQELFHAIVNDPLVWPDDVIVARLSPSVMDLVESLLQKEPSRRLSCDQVRSHPWLVSGSRPRSMLATSLVEEEDVSALELYNEDVVNQVVGLGYDPGEVRTVADSRGAGLGSVHVALFLARACWRRTSAGLDHPSLVTRIQEARQRRETSGAAGRSFFKRRRESKKEADSEDRDPDGDEIAKILAAWQSGEATSIDSTQWIVDVKEVQKEDPGVGTLAGCSFISASLPQRESEDVHSLLIDGPECTRALFSPRRNTIGLPAECALAVPVAGAVLLCFRRAPHPGGLTWVHFHGRGELVQDAVTPTLRSRLPRLHDVLVESMGTNVLLVEYRGYGGSTGEIRASDALDDALLAALASGAAPRRMIVSGHDVGGLLAAHLAGMWPEQLAGLVLEGTPFDVAPLLVNAADEQVEAVEDEEGQVRLAEDVLQEAAELLDPGPNLARFRGPLLVFHAADDHVVPLSHARRLLEAAGASSETKRIITFPHGGHVGLFQSNKGWYLREIRRFLRLCHGGAASRSLTSSTQAIPFRHTVHGIPPVRVEEDSWSRERAVTSGRREKGGMV